MKKLLLLTFFSVWLLASCTRDNARSEANPLIETVDTTPEVKPAVTAAKFFQQLAPLSLPFTATCAFHYEDASYVDTASAGHFLQPYEKPYKKIQVNDKVDAFIALAPADEILPKLRTFTKAGVLIDEYDLKFNRCGGEPGYEHTEQYQITKDLYILHTDSTARWQFDSAFNEIPNTRTLSVTRKRIKIYPNGEIIEVK